MSGTTLEETDADWWTSAGVEIENWTEEQLRTFVASKLDSFGKNITEKCLELYPFEENARRSLVRLITDSKATCGNNYLTEKAAHALESGVFRYIVTSRPSRPIHAFHAPHPAKYAFHGWDLFAFFDEISYWTGAPETTSDTAFRMVMQEIVMNFVREGAPLNPAWREFPRTALLAETITFEDHYLKEQCDFWFENNFFNYTWCT